MLRVNNLPLPPFFRIWLCLLIVATIHLQYPYNPNVGVQKIPNHALWKPMVAKRNDTNPWSWLKTQILLMHDSHRLHMAKLPTSRDWPEQIYPLVHSSQTARQLFNFSQSLEIRIPHLLSPVGQLHKNVFHTFDSVSLCCKHKISCLSGRLTHAYSLSSPV